MRKYDFILSYDIADPKRLRKIAGIVEKKAMRLQYSVYIIFNTTQDDIYSFVNKIDKLYNKEKDDIRIYRIKHYGIHMCSAIDLQNPYDFI